MSEVVWTPSQDDAINAENTSLLVSASAGSGKSTIMVERIIRHITDEDNPIDIEKMCIVTFTKAATFSLKEKIKKAIRKKIEKDPNNRFLRNQLSNLPNATIATINSFCYGIVKENFSKLEISPSVRIADDAEEANLEYQIMSEVIEDFYTDGAGLGIEDFAHFCSSFSDLKDDKLEKIFLSLYNSISSCVQGLDILLENVRELMLVYNGGELFETKWGKVIKDHTKNLLESVSNNIEKEQYLSDNLHLIDEKYGNKIRDIADAKNRINTALEIGYKAVYDIFPLTFSQASRKGEKNERTEFCLKYYTDVFKKISDIFEYGINDNKIFAQKSAMQQKKLYIFLSYFEKKLNKEKKSRGIISFNDCERLCVNLLYKFGEPTDVALEYRNRFAEVYIDEYQDVNPMQDMIFKMISRPNGRFIVGDIKQSIYLFRSAAPGLFDEYRNEYVDYDVYNCAQGKETNSRIFLSENFRSSKNVVDFSNMIARTLFVNGKSEIAYFDGDDLVCKKGEKQTGDDLPIHLDFFQKQPDYDAEALYVADEIQKLQESGELLSDIAILVRNKSHLIGIAKELKERGIPLCFKTQQNFFELPEIELLLCYLYTIDNPRLDLYVCGIMKSPIYNFSVDEIDKIRKEEKNGTLFEALERYSEKHSYQKGKNFISEISELREFARGNSADKLLWKLYYEKGVLNRVCKGKNKDGKRSNLLLFYDNCRHFENGDFKGLYDFLRYIEALCESSSQKIEVGMADTGESVRAYTIHASKGLEFKFCFICGMGSPFRQNDNKIIYNNKLGVFGQISDDTSLALYDTVFFKSLQIKNQSESRDESIRLLYVALTRAKSALWITGTTSGNARLDNFIEKCENSVNFISRYFLDYSSCYANWIWTVVSARKDKNIPINLNYHYEYTPVDFMDATDIEADTDEAECEIDSDIINNVSFVYDYESVRSLPAKLSVSRLYPEVLDEYSTDINSVKPNEKIPSFALANKISDSAARGTATHLFMQFCDFDNVDKNGVEDEIKEMIEKGFYSDEDAELVFVDELKVFFESELYKRMREAKEIFREKRFNVNLPASDFTARSKEIMENEQVLVQGVIDCFFYDENGDVILVDYKTDRTPKDKESAKNLLIQRHSSQLGYYKKALEIITGDKISRTVIYSFGMGGEVEL